MVVHLLLREIMVILEIYDLTYFEDAAITLSAVMSSYWLPRGVIITLPTEIDWHVLIMVGW